jgi:hypothetical protein
VKTYTDINQFEAALVGHDYDIVVPRGNAGYVVAYDYKGRAVARIFVTYC